MDDLPSVQTRPICKWRCPNKLFFQTTSCQSLHHWLCSSYAKTVWQIVVLRRFTALTIRNSLSITPSSKLAFSQDLPTENTLPVDRLSARNMVAVREFKYTRFFAFFSVTFFCLCVRLKGLTVHFDRRLTELFHSSFIIRSVVHAFNQYSETRSKLHTHRQVRRRVVLLSAAPCCAQADWLT